MTQLELGLDPAEERRVALAAEGAALDSAINQVATNANDEWLAYAKYVVRQVARSHETFIVDAVWEAGLGKPPEARAMGPVMQWAAAEGLIEATADFLPSAQPGCHRVPRRVWRSRVFEATP